MKREFVLFLVGCTFLLAACAGLAASAPAPQADQTEELDEVQPVYQLETACVSHTVYSEDEAAELAFYSYQLLTLSLESADALSPEAAEAAERNLEVFNGKMAGVMEELEDQGLAVESIAEEVYENGYGGVAYYDNVVSYGAIEGEILSVWSYRNCYTGGAHPNSYASSYLFDLSAGQFVLDPSQLADDPAAFQAGTAELLIEKADSDEPDSRPGGYWDDYQDIIRNGSGGVTLFDEAGMTVIYAPYELGPYAIGVVELHLTWEELEPLLGPGGMERLGRTEAEQTDN